MVGAAAQIIEVRPKATTPNANTRRSPNRSPSDPPISSSDPSVTRYAFEVHCWPARPPPRSRAMAGRATFTTVESTVTTVVPRMQATRIHRLRCEVTVGPAYARGPLARPARPGRRDLRGHDASGAPL